MLNVDSALLFFKKACIFLHRREERWQCQGYGKNGNVSYPNQRSLSGDDELLNVVKNVRRGDLSNAE